MNNQNLLLEALEKSAYNKYLKPYYFDLELLSKQHPHIVVAIEHNATSAETLCNYLGELLLDTRGHTRGGFHPNVAYFLLSLYTQYRPTPQITTYE